MWDPVLLIAQIISLQSLHYLTLSFILPPLLYTFTNSQAISYTHGGSATVGMVMDWREMAGRSTLTPTSLADSVTSQFWSWIPSSSSTTRSRDTYWFLGHSDIDAHVDPTNHAPSGSLCGKDEIGGWRLSLEHSPRGHHSKKSEETTSLTAPRADEDKDTESPTPLANPSIRDPLRSWVISVGWLIASGIDIYVIYTLVRRPTMVLDFALTLILNHTILTTYYASSFPTSLFFWLIMSIGALLLIVFAEQLCVRRELREGLKTVTSTKTNDGMHMGRRGLVGPSQEELFNANLERMGDHDHDNADNDDDDDDDDLAAGNEYGHERIELMERGMSR